MKRQLSLIALLLSSTLLMAQNVFSGTGGYTTGYIYEDGLLDDGTRYIISDMRQSGAYILSLCKFIPVDGESWYGIAVESKQYIPKNGLLVFVGELDGATQTFVLGQRVADKAIATRGSIGINPIFFFGGGGNMALALYSKTVHSEVCYAIYELSPENIDQLTSSKIKEIRISSRSTYNFINGSMSSITKWLIKARQEVDNRSKCSVNMILEDVK